MQENLIEQNLSSRLLDLLDSLVPSGSQEICVMHCDRLSTDPDELAAFQRALEERADQLSVLDRKSVV